MLICALAVCKKTCHLREQFTNRKDLTVCGSLPTFSHMSYVKYTNHFLQLMEDLGEVREMYYLVTLDMTLIYTNIPNEGWAESHLGGSK